MSQNERGSCALTYVGTRAELALRNGSLNLVTRALLRDLNSALSEIESHADLRCLILHGGDARAFCAGSDMKEFAALGTNASEDKILFEDMVLRRLDRLPLPTIAAIDGPALGGGFELALACDLRIVRRGVALGLPESQIGGLAGNGTVRLTRLIGPGRARELLFTGRTILDDEALTWGLINQVSDQSALESARALADTICARGPLSNRLAKKLSHAAQDLPLEAALSMSTTAQQQIFESHDLHEGAAAFFAKRQPVFKGR
jgi:enoyl-CoA hydratase